MSHDAGTRAGHHLEIQAHDHSRIGIKAMMRFCFPETLDTWSELILRQDTEAKMLIQRPIPRNVPEVRQGDSLHTSRDGPSLDVLDQGTSYPLAPSPITGYG